MRKVIQLTAAGHDNTSQTQSNMSVFALCDDGAIFVLHSSDRKWCPVPDIPQPVNGTKRESDRICHALGGIICETEE